MSSGPSLKDTTRKLGLFVGAEVGTANDATAVAILIKYVRGRKHMARVKAGETAIASVLMMMEPDQARSLAAALINFAEKVESHPQR